MRNCLIILLCYITSFAFADSKPMEVSTDTLIAVNILSKTQTVYANLKTYIDSCTVDSRIYNDGKYPDRTTRYIFKTAYQSTGQFAFEYYQPDEEKSIYTYTRQADNTVKTWYAEENKTKIYSNIVQVLSTTWNVFPPQCVFIPGLLLEEYHGQPNILNTLRQINLTGSEAVNGHDCYKISAFRLDSVYVNIWINKADLLILKFETDGPEYHYRIARTWFIYPQTPQHIAQSLFAFRPKRYIDIYSGIWQRIIYSRFGALNALLLLIGLFYLIRWLFRKKAMPAI